MFSQLYALCYVGCTFAFNVLFVVLVEVLESFKCHHGELINKLADKRLGIGGHYMIFFKFLKCSIWEK